MSPEELVRLEELARSRGDPVLRWKILSRLARSPSPHIELIHGAAESAILEGDPMGCLVLASATLRRVPDSVPLLDVAADAASILQTKHARPRIDAWLAAAPDRTETLVAALDRYTRIGAMETAREVAKKLENVDAPEARAALAERALWRADLAGARELASDDLPLSRRVRAGCHVLAGRATDALPLLDRIIADNTRDDVAHAWRAEALIQLTRYEDARKSADMAMMRAATFSLPARVLRFLTLIADNRDPGETLNDELLDQLVPLFGRDPPPTRETLTKALAAFGGNRTSHLTIVENGKLKWYRRPPDPRARARRAQMVLKVRGPAAAEAALDALIVAHRRHPLVRTYRGELMLWCGRIDEATAEFEAAIKREDLTKWAWIGLGACSMIRREYPRALEIWAEGVEVTKFAGPTLWAYQGETRRLMGDLDGAWNDLQIAVDTSPRRLATHINRALVEAERGDDRSARTLAQQLAKLNPDLLVSAPAVPQLELALAKMRGNRSSSLITWFDQENRMRVARWTPPTGKTW